MCGDQKIKCITIDDEKLSLDLLTDSITKIPFLKLIAAFVDPFDAIGFINKNKINLIFSNIEMKGLSGIQLINSLKTKPLVVLISSQDKYAIDGYNLDAVDYLIKPVPFDRLLKAANKAYDIFINDRAREFIVTSDPHLMPQNSIFIKSDYKIIKLNIQDILYIEGFNDYVKIHVTDSKPILTLLSLKTLEEKLPPNEFIRVHRSYIISVNKIHSIEKKRITINKEHIPISQSYHSSFFDFIKKMNFFFY